MKRRDFVINCSLVLSGVLGLSFAQQQRSSTRLRRGEEAVHKSAKNRNEAYSFKRFYPAGESFLLRPPGSRSEEEFLSTCIRCGLCAIACPFNTLYLTEIASAKAANTPVFCASSQPCYLCDDMPCVCACPTSALDKNTTPKSANIGTAVLDSSTCVAHFGIQCDACYRACPLIDSALNLEYRRNERTGKHALLVPVVDEAACVGCGCCEHACITEKPAIIVVPKNLARGKRNDNYVKGWVEGDDEILRSVNTEHSVDSARAMDYLNEGSL